MTLISFKYKFIFIANPKCGSTTIHQLLQPYSDITSMVSIHDKPFSKHASASRVKEILEENKFFGRKMKWEDFYVFTTIRNPYRKLESAYAFTMETQAKKSSQRALENKQKMNRANSNGDNQELNPFHYNKDKLITFHQFLDGKHINSIAIEKMIYDDYRFDDRKCLVNEIIKLEEFDKKLPQLFEKLKIPVKYKNIPKILKTPNKNIYKTNWGVEYRKKIVEMYSEDFKLGNYQTQV